MDSIWCYHCNYTKNTIGNKITNMKLSSIILGENRKQTTLTEQEYYLGYDISALESLMKYLQREYEESVDYVAHIERGDDLPNAITILNSRLEGDKVLMTLIDLAEDKSYVSMKDAGHFDDYDL